MLIIPGGFSFVEFDTVSTFTNPKRIESLLKAGTGFTPKTLTEEFADNKSRSAAKAVDMTIRSADVNNGGGSIYAALKVYEETRTPLYFRFVKLLNDDLVVEDCEDAWNESVNSDVTSGVDTDNYKQGSKSALLTVDSALSAQTILATEVIAKNLTSCKAISCWIKHQYGAPAGDFQLLLDNTALCASPLEILTLPILPVNTWKKCLLMLADPAALGSLISIGLKAYNLIDFNLPAINIDDVRGVTGHVTVLNGIIPKVIFEYNEAGRHNAIKVMGEGFADTESNLLTTNF
jgi:hypothetical protein